MRTGGGWLGWSSHEGEVIGADSGSLGKWRGGCLDWVAGWPKMQRQGG